ncbi:metal-sensing transcriptional repressor [Streptomyces griseoincarnatus]
MVSNREEAVTRRLRHIEGQIRGLQGMVEADICGDRRGLGADRSLRPAPPADRRVLAALPCRPASPEAHRGLVRSGGKVPREHGNVVRALYSVAVARCFRLTGIRGC